VVVFASTRDVKLLLLLNDMAVLLSLIFLKKPCSVTFHLSK
jgi:hypothetical protein